MNPYESPQEEPETPRKRPMPWMLALLPPFVLASLILSGFGALLMLDVCENWAIDVAYQRDPNGYYDSDALTGDELPEYVWYSPWVVFWFLMSVFISVGYFGFRRPVRALFDRPNDRTY